ncbi:MAG: ATP synthase F1 subunit gamma [Chloroflexi bacterium]|nr:ATP synthase F1 subunit gamma [Chloroflexota bacterium]MBM3182413.1 ATP synthase F1 subunit gamma [Chloroflexota bacterium]MBM4450978.1 ATP synthase F1 subunit gamma [Chloroflexota bacterium]MBM4453152.1 ATP synthase F1 subunit gamma [Chloroflexota bacterium]
MISPRLLRRRIRSVQNTAKITKAMEMIATAKMRRAQENAIAGRPYNDKIQQVISDLAAETSGGGPLHPLLEKRAKINRIAIVHITTDRGLCGGLNANMNRLTGNFILQQSMPVTLITIGRKGRDFMLRNQRDLRAEFTKIGDRPKLLDTIPISHIVLDDYANHYVDQVYIAYPRFITVMVQNPTMEQLLPIEPTPIPKTETTEYIYEPSPQFVLGELLPRYVDMRIYHAILEAIASEQAARMVAMRNATENANEVINGLTLILNKARQEMITTDLLDITGGVESLR